MKATGLVPLLAAAGFLTATSRQAAAAEPGGLELARQLNQAFADVAEKVSPSVVVITVREKAATPAAGAPEDGSDAPFRSAPPGVPRRFGHSFQQEPPETGEASGVIIRKDGYILTNAHVIDNADQIEVRLRDGRRFQARVRGADPISDVAVIKIEADDLPVVRFADSSRTRVGEFAIALGAPFALDYTVTFGHVSAKGRSNVIPPYEGGWAMDQDFIQTDANINPGNSGGPLVNIEGEVIGINTLIRGLHTGIGFAIPGNLAKEVSERLIAKGKFARAWLGISIRALRDEPDFGAPTKGATNGVIVKAIIRDGPSAKSDLRPDDVITALDGAPVSTPQQLRDEMRHKQIGRPVTLHVSRGGRAIDVRVVPGESVETRLSARPERPAETSAPSGLGMTVHPLTPELAGRFGVAMTNGVIVVAVDRDSPAASKGIKPGDVITALGQQTTASPEQFTAALKLADLKKGVVVNLLSGGTARFEILKEDTE